MAAVILWATGVLDSFSRKTSMPIKNPRFGGVGNFFRGRRVGGLGILFIFGEGSANFIFMGVVFLIEGPTSKPWQALGFFSTRSGPQAVPAFHCKRIRMLRDTIVWHARLFPMHQHAVTAFAFKSSKKHFDVLMFLKAHVSTNAWPILKLALAPV